MCFKIKVGLAHVYKKPQHASPPGPNVVRRDGPWASKQGFTFACISVRVHPTQRSKLRYYMYTFPSPTLRGNMQRTLERTDNRNPA